MDASLAAFQIDAIENEVLNPVIPNDFVTAVERGKGEIDAQSGLGDRGCLPRRFNCRVRGLCRLPCGP